MKFSKAIAWPLFVFWTALAFAMLVVIALHPLDGQWWLLLVMGVGGAALYFPFPGAARVRKTISVKRPLGEVYAFLSRPANLHIWNPRVGMAQPADIRVEVGQEWTYSPVRRWIPTPPLRHAFSRVNPPHTLEITATGHGLRAIYAYILRDVGEATEVTVDATIFGLPAPAAWLNSVIGRFYPSRDLARLKRVLEIGTPSKDPSPSH